MKFTDKQEFEKANKFGTGAPNTAYAKFFIGDSFLNPLTAPKTINLDLEKIADWQSKGAQLTDAVAALVKAANEGEKTETVVKKSKKQLAKEAEAAKAAAEAAEGAEE